MKELTKIFALAVIFIFTTGSISAQGNEHPLLVVSYQKVKLSDIETVNKMFNEKFAPILNTMVDDKFIHSWGLFNHSWGDDWNVNVWYIADDMSSFEKFWKEYRKRMNEKDPDAFKNLVGYIQDHKDNIYSIQNQYPVPPRN